MTTNKPNKIIVHHTGGTDLDPMLDTSGHTVNIVDNHHKTLWPGFTSKVHKNYRGQFFHVGYHYFIDKEGKVTQTRDWNEEGAHTRGQNTQSIGICLAGNFDLTLPTRPQLKSFKKLFKELEKGLGLGPSTIYPHRKFAAKTCYGKNLEDDYFNKLVVGTMELEDLDRPQLIAMVTSLQALIGKLTEKITGKRYSSYEISRK